MIWMMTALCDTVFSLIMASIWSTRETESPISLRRELTWSMIEGSSFLICSVYFEMMTVLWPEWWPSIRQNEHKAREQVVQNKLSFSSGWVWHITEGRELVNDEGEDKKEEEGVWSNSSREMTEWLEKKSAWDV